MPKVVLLSQFELPYHKIGSWTTMYNYYLKTGHRIDYLICPEPKEKINSLEYSIVKASLLDKSKQKVLNKRYLAPLNALEAIIEKDEKYIIQVVDNFGIVNHLNKLLGEKYLRSNFYIQFFYHGYPPFYNNVKGRPFFESIDEMVLLTADSYQRYKEFYTNLPCRFSIQHNGIDRNKFKPIYGEEKAALKSDLEVDGKIVFLWCSQDRPKKGLDLILDVWKRIYKGNDNLILWIVGAKRDIEIEGVRFIGIVPHDKIHEYYQATSIYLFPSLNKEGFGLSLAEALACGNYCIASNNGGIPEVLNYGEYGVLVNRPNFIEDWVEAIQDALKNIHKHKFSLPSQKYDIDVWCKNMNDKIESAKISLS